MAIFCIRSSSVLANVMAPTKQNSDSLEDSNTLLLFCFISHFWPLMVLAASVAANVAVVDAVVVAPVAVVAAVVAAPVVVVAAVVAAPVVVVAVIVGFAPDCHQTDLAFDVSLGLVFWLKKYLYLLIFILLAWICHFSFGLNELDEHILCQKDAFSNEHSVSHNYTFVITERFFYSYTLLSH